MLAGSVALAAAMGDGVHAALWFLGIAAGFTLQRSRFCFTSAFRDLFLFGSARTLKAVLVALGLTAIGFSAIMHGAVPLPSLGLLPDQAHVLPVGISTVVGGLLFGFGMVLAGGCVSGSLYRAAEGYVGSWVTLGGVVAGLAVVNQSWNWLWVSLLQHEPKIWLPAVSGLGYAGALALTLAILIGLYVLVTWWEARAELVTAPRQAPAAPPVTFEERIGATWVTVFVHGWPAMAGGAAIALISVVMYTIHMPWGVTGELGRWANAAMTVVGAAPPAPLGLEGLGGCTAQALDAGFFGHTFSVTVGILPGALIAAILAKEFKIRVPRRPVRYAQSLGGGVAMGLGAGIAIGCTVGSFFSAVASLSVSGWLFGAALAAGAYLGVLAIRRIP